MISGLRIASMLMMVVVMVMIYGSGYGGKWASAQVHHVVGDDPGWDIGSDIASWAKARTFNVGDILWFAYSGGLDKDNVVELRNKEEFESCDVSNPIKMYLDGLDNIPLLEEGIRYFASSNPHHCNKGLKLHVEVMPQPTAKIESTPSQKTVSAQQPTAPSSSTKICRHIIMMIIAGLVFSFVTI